MSNIGVQVEFHISSVLIFYPSQQSAKKYNSLLANAKQGTIANRKCHPLIRGFTDTS